MVKSSTVVAHEMQETQQKIFDCAPGLAAMTERSTVGASDFEESESEDAGDSDWDECWWPRLSEAALLAHEKLMESCEGQVAHVVALHCFEESMVGSVSTEYFSAHSNEECVTDSDGTPSQSSVSDAESEPRSPPGPHRPDECQPCCFFARGICRREHACSYCHEHPYVQRPIKRFGKGSRSLKRLSEKASPNMFA